jgi:hypothetical protein
MYQYDLRLGSLDPSEMSTRQKQRSMIRRLPIGAGNSDLLRLV